ncbi:hypothetical protein [Leucobacter chromiireducens]|uniref:hypothetical protein n=1 Tax=Leucobacter chromiireducens TaxID=283877 RepID=UPI001926B10E|nr:hypothetical protein [Leucobacter chromiireducens]
MIRASKRTSGIIAVAVAGLLASTVAPSSAFATAESVSAEIPPVSTFVPAPAEYPESIFDVQVTEGGFTYQLPGAGSGSDHENTAAKAAGIGVGCQGAYVLRKVSNYIEWGANNTCTGTPDKKYLPWYINGSLQRANVGSNSFSTVHGNFSTPDRWGSYGALSKDYSCLGGKKYKYRVKWNVQYTGLNSGTFYSDVKTIACT